MPETPILWDTDFPKSHHFKEGKDPKRYVPKSEKSPMEDMSDRIWGNLQKGKPRVRGEE